jgi:hypothetical protein
MANLSDKNIRELCPVIDRPAIVAVDNGDGPWCPEDYDPEFLTK